MTPETHTFEDDGGIPNSPLPVLGYQAAVDRHAGADQDPVSGAGGPLVELWRA